jgi:hypothetical protein
MDWPGAIEANCDNLIRIVTRLFIMAGIRTGLCVLTLPRELRIRILLILRPAEFAARRLIMMAACKLDLELPEATGARQRRAVGEELKGGTDDSARQQGTDSGSPLTNKETTSGSPSTNEETCSGLPIGADKTPTIEDETSGSHQQGRTPTREYETSGARRRGAPDSGLPLTKEKAPTLKNRTEKPPVFQLFDPFKRFGPLFLTEEEFAALNDPGRVARPPETDLPPDEPVGVRSVCRRILALIYALDDLEGQARRLARWRARRSAEWSSSSGLTRGPGRSSPMRWGRPPGWKERPKSEIEEVLRECHSLAQLAWDSPDTS